MVQQDDTEQLIEDVLNKRDLLTEWEVKFIENIYEKFTESGSITPNQYGVLSDLWEKVVPIR